MEFRFLRILKRGAMPITHLRNMVNVNGRTLQKHLKHLDNNQLVKIHVDGRLKKVSITELGSKRLEELEKILNYFDYHSIDEDYLYTHAFKM